MNAELLREFFIGDMSVFVCYAHKDNESSDPSKRWLDRLLEFLRPLTRYGNVTPWSDTDIPVGGPWEAAIEEALDRAKAAVLLVTPALLDSEYIFRSEVPVLLKRAKERGMKILPILVEPSLYHKARFKYPDWKSGPHELLLGSLQSINPPSRTLIDMEKAEQNRVFLQVAEQLEQWLEEDRVRTEQEAARAKEQEERERAARLESMKREIEEASSLETSRHTFIGDICSGCRLNVMTIAHFKKYRCSKMFDENS